MVQKTGGNRRVSFNAPVTQKGPIAARILDGVEVDFLDQDGFAVMRRLGQNAAEGVSDKRAAPELEPDARGAVATYISIFMADTVDGGDIDAIGDCMGPLNGLPRVILRRSKGLLLRRMPADRGGIKEQIRSAQGGDASRFRIPLIPTDQRAHLSHGGVEGFETQVAGREIEFFVVERVVGDVHLAVDSAQRSITLQ